MKTLDKQLLTHTRMSTLKQCFRKHYYRFEVGITKSSEAKALRMGSAIHLGLEYWGKGRSVDDAVVAIRNSYADTPEWALDHLDEWFTECETIVALICGYYWYYANDDLVILDTESVFQIPLENPDGGKSLLFDLGGKRDAKARLVDGRIALMEHKSCSEDIAPGSDYWLRLRIDQQISLYYMAGQQDETDKPETVLYSVIRKPSIQRLLATPEEKRKFKKDGTLYANQREEDQTPTEFGERLLADIGERPDFYYQRKEIPRLDADIETFRHELWQTQKTIRQCQLNSHWFRNVSFNTCPYCEFKDLCYNDMYPIGDETPTGFIRLGDVHPELQLQEISDATEPTAASSDTNPDTKTV